MNSRTGITILLILGALAAMAYGVRLVQQARNATAE